MMSSAEKGVLEHVAVSIRLRAPRVAIVVPDREPWQYFAGVALHRAATIWGGAGFILVPHQEGAVDPLMLRIASAYDPDHVVSTTAPIADLIDLRPELYTTSLDLLPELKALHELDPENVGWPMSSTEVRAVGNPDFFLSPFDGRARVKLSDACTPYQESLTPEEPERDHLIYLQGTDDGTRLLNVSIEAYESLELSYTDPAVRDFAVVAASRRGDSSLPTPSTANSDLSDEDLRGHARHILGLSVVSHEFGHWPSGFQLMRGAGSAWKPSLRGLTYVNNPRAGRTVWLVVGSEFSDFALSLALDRIDGYAVWLPSRWLNSDSIFRSVARDQLSELRWRHQSEGSKVHLVTVSGDLGGVHEACQDLATQGWSIGPGDDNQDWLLPTALDQVVCEGRGHLVLEGDYDRDLALPVERRHNGDCIFATPVPAITPETPEMRESPISEWHVDINPSAHEMPRGRGLTGEALYQQTSARPERLRSGRDGISLMSRSFGLIQAGATVRQSLARPKLRLPGLMSWVTAQTKSAGLAVQISDAGHRASIAVRLWGDRTTMADDLLRYFAFFKEFLCTTSQKTSQRYPDDDGCVIRGEGYLTFQAAVRVMQTSGLEPSGIRDRLDDFTYTGILRRGVILRCRDCAHAQWIPLSRLDRITPCIRCSAQIPLARFSWNLPIEEPRWFYDLHPVIRELLRDHGDVAILAGRQLQSADKGVVVLPELTFSKDDTRLYEVDLVAGSQKLVAVCECKSKPAVPSDEHNKKLTALVQTATHLRADRVVLAAGDPGTWGGAFLDKLRDRLHSQTWVDGRRPQIQLMTGLRTATPQVTSI